MAKDDRPWRATLEQTTRSLPKRRHPEYDPSREGAPSRYDRGKMKLGVGPPHLYKCKCRRRLYCTLTKQPKKHVSKDEDAPHAPSHLMTATCPPLDADMRGVIPLSSCVSTRAPAFARRATDFALPQVAAICKAVCSHRFLAVKSAPFGNQQKNARRFRTCRF